MLFKENCKKCVNGSIRFLPLETVKLILRKLSIFVRNLEDKKFLGNMFRVWEKILSVLVKNMEVLVKKIVLRILMLCEFCVN